MAPKVPRLPGLLRALALPERFQVLPGPVIGIIGLLLFINALVWAAVGIVLHFNPGLVGAAVLSYTLGLRHALDADHISAIDLMTRRLIAMEEDNNNNKQQQPVTVGTFFSLGHSTVVVVTCVAVAATAGALRDRFDNFQYVGGIIGTSVSAAVLILLCLGNGWVLFRLLRTLRQVLREEGSERGHQNRRNGNGNENGHENRDGETPADGADVTTTQGHEQEAAEEEDARDRRELHMDGPGFLARALRKVFRIVDRPWKMYPLGVLFGLGFDTSSEIAVLGIASVHGAQGTSLWVILIFPLLFTAGMCLVDTTDGALMMTLYTSKAFARDRVAILYYSIVLTGITVVVSAFIGVIQILSLVQNVADPQGSFWDGLTAIGDHYEIVGAAIVGVFALAGLGSVIIYQPWRRRMERRQWLQRGAPSATGPADVCHD